jgi:elongator complex protein 3
MDFSEKRQNWKKINTLTPQKLELAHHVLDEIREGSDVMKACAATHWMMVISPRLRWWPPTTKWWKQARSNQTGILLERIRMKPMRTLSGVTTVTVLTKPYPCPGKCIFCPTDVRMPKSYLPDEPGAMRALEHKFDPYEQVHNRLRALTNLGHPTDKIELLILGGTWSSYRRDYQEWFVTRCFDAMNDAPTENTDRTEKNPNPRQEHCDSL